MIVTSVFSFSQNNSYPFSPLPNDKILDLHKKKAFANDKINVNKKLKTYFGKSRDIVGEREELLVTSIVSFPTMFPRLSL